MNRTVYIIQPTYRTMDGRLIKELPIFNYFHNLPILSAAIPDTWRKRVCLEHVDDIDFECDAGVVLITSPGYDLEHALEIAREFRRRGRIVLFGAHMESLSDRIMRSECHSVFYGYPDREQMQAILDDAEAGTIAPEYPAGWSADYPFDYSTLPRRGLRMVPVIAGLGCRNSCRYCCYTPIYKGHYRLRHIDNVIADLRQAKEFGCPISFLDANLYSNREYLRRLCRRIIDEGLDIEWGGQLTIDVGDDPETLALLRASGCRMLFFGLESLDQRNLDWLGKPYRADRYAEQLQEVHRAGIDIGAFFILGLEHDTRQSFTAIERFIDRTPISIPYLHILFPIPGTPLYHELVVQSRVPIHLFDQFEEYRPRFSVPCSYAYFTPKMMSVSELERAYLEMSERLYSLPRIIRRVALTSPRYMPLVLWLNLDGRRRTRAMMRAQREGTDAANVALVTEGTDGAAGQDSRVMTEVLSTELGS